METVSESPIIPVSALETNHEHSALPVAITKTVSEFTPYPIMARKAPCEHYDCPDEAKGDAHELTVCPASRTDLGSSEHPASTLGVLIDLFMFCVSVSPRPQSLPWLSNRSALLWWSSALLWWSSAPLALTWWSSAPPWLPALPTLLWLLVLSTPPWTQAPLFHSLPLFHGPGPPMIYGLLLLHGAGPQLCNSLPLLHGSGLLPFLCLPHGPVPPSLHLPPGLMSVLL